MVSRYLITTAEQQTWVQDQPVLFLGEWCKRFSRQDQWQNLDSVIVSYHWDDRELLFKNFSYLQALCERVMKSLVEVLNGYHGVNHTMRYWRILIGPWLTSFAHILFDHWQMIHKAVNEYELSGSTVLEINSETMVPLGMKDYETLITSDLWNHWIYGEIIKSQTVFSNWTGGADMSVGKSFGSIAGKSRNAKSPEITLRSRGQIKNLVRSFLNKFSEALGKNKDYFFYGSYLGRRQWLLELALRQCPSYWTSQDGYEQANISNAQRDNLTLNLNSESPFEKFLFNLIPKQLPVLYLEGYSSLIQKTKSVRWPKNPKVIITGSSYVVDDFFKAWTAEKLKKNTKLVIWQHGGYYGTRPALSSQEHEQAIADGFFSWGWKDPDSSITKALPSGKLLHAMDTLKANPLGGLLLVLNSHPRYGYLIDCHPMASSCEQYMEEQIRFAEALDPEIREKLRVRLYLIDYGWDQMSRWQERLPDTCFDEAGQTLEKSINQNRLVIGTYNGTHFIETLAANVPTVMYWNSNNYWEIHKSAQPYFDQMEEVKIFHRTPESAAAHIGRIWNDVEGWWQQENVQHARKDFCDQYALTSSNWLMQWKQAVQKN